MTVDDIASWLNGEIVGDKSRQVDRVAKIEEAGERDLTFLANPKYEKHLKSTRAAAILVSKEFDVAKYADHSSLTFIKVNDPYAGFIQILQKVTPHVEPFGTGIHPTAVVSPTAKVGANVFIGAYAVIDDGATIGDNSKVGHGCVIGREAVVGEGCILYPNVTVYHQCKLGRRVVLHSGAVIGSDGFGFATKPDGTYEKIPQMGIVLIEDDVEIGANCAIDRAMLGETRIRRGAKLDNLIQVGHNVVIGEDTGLAAQVGISGSTKIGSKVMIGGQVGLAGHLEVADRSVILAQSGVTKSITTPGQAHFGTPAKEQRKAHRMEAALRMLPQLIQEFRELQQKIERLMEKNRRSSSHSS